MREFRWKTGLLALMPVLFVLLSAAACRKKEAADAGIGIQIEETASEDGTLLQIPVFYSDEEGQQQSLRELEKETKKLRKICEKADRKGEHLEMRCYPAGDGDYPQVTVIWYIADESTRQYDLITLGTDEKEGLPITCREALERAGISGVDLTLQVGKLAQESGMRGEISTMEMQGFRIDGEGTVREVYMKLLMEIREEEETLYEEHFFSYDLEGGSLVKLSEKGYDVP